VLGASRIIIVLFCALFIIGGALLAVVAGSGGIVVGLVMIVTGAAGVGAVVFERMRYRSDAEERTRAPSTMTAGGDPAGTRLPPTFRPTDERFVDPATGVPMRVWYEPGSGERRYLPDDVAGGAAW
jgi:hypothetical protein